MSNFTRRSSVIKGIGGCLDAIVLVQVNNVKVQVSAIACSRDVARDRDLLVQRVLDSAKVQGVAEVRGVDIGTQEGVNSIYSEAILSSNVTAQIVSYRFRYNTRDRRIKTVNRGGKRFNYVFDRNTGKIITYTKFEAPRSIENFLDRE